MLDLSKPVRTKDGRQARIYAIDGAGAYPVHGAFTANGGEGWIINAWDKKGHCTVVKSAVDLVNYDNTAE